MAGFEPTSMQEPVSVPPFSASPMFSLWLYLLPASLVLSPSGVLLSLSFPHLYPPFSSSPPCPTSIQVTRPSHSVPPRWALSTRRYVSILTDPTALAHMLPKGPEGGLCSGVFMNAKPGAAGMGTHTSFGVGNHRWQKDILPFAFLLVIPLRNK